MVEVDCQSFSGVPFFFLEKYRHITLAKDYTLIHSQEADNAANMQRFHVLFGTWELNFVPVICEIQFDMQISIQFYSREGIYIL